MTTFEGGGSDTENHVGSNLKRGCLTSSGSPPPPKCSRTSDAICRSLIHCRDSFQLVPHALLTIPKQPHGDQQCVIQYRATQVKNMHLRHSLTAKRTQYPLLQGAEFNALGQLGQLRLTGMGRQTFPPGVKIALSFLTLRSNTDWALFHSRSHPEWYSRQEKRLATLTRPSNCIGRFFLQNLA